MLTFLDKFLERRSPWQIMAATLLFVALIGAIDYVTGVELTLAVFYLVPIAIGTWYAGRRAGTLLSIVSATAWVIADRTAWQDYSLAFVPYWNTGVRFGFLIMTAELLAVLKTHLEIERNMAHVDSLTGIKNGRAFTETAQALLGVAARHQRPTVVGYIDLDNFKRVNDTLGHAEGNRVLQAIASTLSKSVRSTDIVGRLGGDEFVLLLPETTGKGAAGVFDMLRKALVKEVDRHGWPIGFSIGVAAFSTPPSSVEEAVRVADTLMYRVKNGGKNSTLIEECGPPPGLPEDMTRKRFAQRDAPIP